MSKIPVSFSQITKIHDPIEVPPLWLDCPRKSTIIADKFIAFKTPLDDRYKKDIPIDKRWTCNILINSIKADQTKLGLVIDLTNTERYYQSDNEFIAKGIRYEKIPCQGHNAPPNDQQIDQFIRICRDFISANPKDIIGVHCTHGLNRTGFLICAYLCQELKYRIDVAIDLFTKARSSGIVKQNYLDKLNQKYGKHNSPVVQSHKYDLNNKRSRNEKDYEQSTKRFREGNPTPMFAVNLDGVMPVSSQSILNNIRLKCQAMCGWDRQSFPGSQPVSMDRRNYKNIFQSPYMVSWKADGTRYMMLIEDQNRIYMLDRNNNIFQISRLQFPKDASCQRHLTNTLIDGEFVIDKDKGIPIYRYLVYDIIIYDNVYVGQKSFKERLAIIDRDIVNVRNEAIQIGRINKSLEPFSIRTKGFWELTEVSTLLSPKFQAAITHGCDGLVFQPVRNPYQPGRSVNILKWKEDNTIDFRLKIDKIGQSQKIGRLYLHNKSTPFASMRYSLELDQYDNQIIECSYQNGEWVFYRHRSDKTFANAQATADGVLEAVERPITKEMLCSLIEEDIAFANY